jgi:nucleoside phosphorylase
VAVPPGDFSPKSGSHRVDPAQVTIAVITAISIETLALEKVMKVALTRFPGDDRPYRVGPVPSSEPSRPHVVAVAQQTSDGTRNAAWLCGHLPHVFPNLRAILMCGIAAGVPAIEPGWNIALGDIVVATEVVDYRHEHRVDGRGSVRSTVRPPAAHWMNADHLVAAQEMDGRSPWLPALDAAAAEEPFRRPGGPGVPRVHRARIGSADLLLRDAVLRDGLAREHRLAAFEMEGAGVAIGAHLGDRSWYMVRGVADHGDDSKNAVWHPYASLVAACYLRAVLERCPPLVSPGGSQGRPGADRLAVMADALVALRVMRNDRYTVLEQLPGWMREQIRENSLPRLHIVETITALERLPGGLDALVSALLRTLGSSSPDFMEVEQILRTNWKQQ